MASAKKSSVRDKYLRRKYGITLAIYDAMLKHGNGKCWICERTPLPGRNLNVDHEHARKKAPGSGGKVRGLLCYFCNKYVIGRSRTEHVGRYRRAADYLESPTDWRNA